MNIEVIHKATDEIQMNAVLIFHHRGWNSTKLTFIQTSWIILHSSPNTKIEELSASTVYLIIL